MIKSPDIAPGKKGTLTLRLPVNRTFFDILYVTAFDPYGREIYTWSWPIHSPEQVAQKIVTTEGFEKVSTSFFAGSP